MNSYTHEQKKAMRVAGGTLQFGSMRFYSFISRNGRRPFYLLIVRILPLESEFFRIMKNMKLSMLDIQILSAKEIPYIFQNKFEIIFQSQTQNTNGMSKRSEESFKYDSYTISECIYFVDFSTINMPSK